MVDKKRASERSTDENTPDVVKRLIKKYKNEVGKSRHTKSSHKWFMEKASKVRNVRLASMMKGGTFKNEPFMGKLYLFNYDAIHKDTLPYWDASPIVFFWDTWVGGNGKFGKSGKRYYIGLNLHYLPPKLRLLLFTSLLRLRNEKRFRKQTKLKMEWSVLQNLSEHPLVKACVHIYRDDAFRSKFIEIPSDQWSIVTQLPLARFKKASQSQVWAKSRKKSGYSPSGKKKKKR